MIKIIEATPKHIPIILSFIKDLAEYEKLSHEVIATKATLKKTLFGKKKTAEVLLAYQDKIPVGFALFFHNYSTFLGKPGIYLEDLFVKPSERGRGVGKLLLQRIAQIAMARKCGRFEWAVLDWNSPAIEFYKKLGAVPMNEWTVYRLTGASLAKLAQP